MKTILRGLGTATPPLYATLEEACEIITMHFTLKPAEQDLYRRILLDGKIKGRYLGMEAKTDALETDPDRLLARFLKFGRTTAVAGMLALSEEGPVLSLAVEICTATIFPSHEPELVVSNSIFSDGASAAGLDLAPDNHPGGLACMVDFAAGLFPHYRENLRYRTEGGRLRNHLTKRVPASPPSGRLWNLRPLELR